MDKSSNYPLVTTYILCYKKFDHLFESINSVLGQDYPKIELIISDDASGNFPYTEIRRFIDSNKKGNITDVIIIINQSNIGTVKNLNKAIKAGKGEYYIGLSGDDVFYDKNTISRIVTRFTESNHDILCCRRLRCDEDSLQPIRLMPNDLYLPIINKIDTPFKQFRAFAIGRYFEMASGSATYFRRNHFNNWGYFDEKYKLWEDGPFYIQYTRAGNIITTAYDIVSTKYREGGISGKKKNSLLINDYERYINSEAYSFINNFKKQDRRFVEFLHIISNSNEVTKYKRNVTYLLYIDVVIKKAIYKIFCISVSLIEKSKIYKLIRKKICKV